MTLPTMKREALGGGIDAFVSERHTFGTDALLLSAFAAPKRCERCLDLCAGCGIVPLLWFRGENAPAFAKAIDIQPEAAALMAHAVEQNGLAGRLEPVLADLREREPAEHAAYDLVTCNPPYKPAGSGIKSADEADQIARHETLCTLGDVVAAAAWRLRFGGRFCLCQLPERLVDVLSLMRAHGLEPKRLRFVQQRADTAPWLVLAEGKRGAKPHLVLEPPLLLDRDKAEYNR